MKNNTIIRLASALMLFFLFSFCAKAQTPVPFFTQNFNAGIPATWTIVDSLGGNTKFVKCDSICLEDYDLSFSEGLYTIVKQFDSLRQSSFKSGAAALRTLRRRGMKTTLTSPAINCSGKDKVFLRFSTIHWGGADFDELQATGNASTACLVRVSNDGIIWKNYTIFEENVRESKIAFMDISEVAANKNRVFIQFRRLGDENNAIWAVDDVHLLDKAPIRNVTVSVDMSSQRVSPKGVYLGHDLSGNWQPNAIRMTPVGDSIYRATMQIPQLSTAHYKFFNGDSWGENESVPSSCGELNAGGYFDRVAKGTNDDYSIDAVCFGACMSCGNRQPQTDFIYCPQNNPDLLYCENFEGMQFAKLVPQVANWTTYSLAFDGFSVPTAKDNPQVTGYWKGFTNFDGTRALRVQNDPISRKRDNPMMYLGRPTEGRYQADFKIYVPKNRSAVVSIDDSTGFSGFTMDFSGDSLYLLEYLDFNKLERRLMRSPVKHKQNDWNDVSLIFNAATSKITVRLNNALILDTIDAFQTSFFFLDFNTYDIASKLNLRAEYFIDNILYRRIANQPQLQNGQTSTAFGATISPNPAHDKLIISPDAKTRDAWQIRLINAQGQVMTTQKGLDAAPIELLTNDCKSGIYIVEFQSAATRWTKKIMIQH